MTPEEFEAKHGREHVFTRLMVKDNEFVVATNPDETGKCGTLRLVDMANSFLEIAKRLDTVIADIDRRLTALEANAK